MSPTPNARKARNARNARKARAMRAWSMCVALNGLALGACSNDAAPTANNTWLATAAPVTPATRPAPAPAPASQPVLAAPSQFAEFNEADFAEGDRSRDPFRGFSARGSVNTRAVINQRNVLIAEYALDDLHLIAIVQGGDEPLAMLIDPKGKGTTLRRGDFVGRSEIARTGGVGSTEYQVNWRVDRIRPGDVVLVREDPAQPTNAPVTRVLTIHSESPELAGTHP